MLEANAIGDKTAKYNKFLSGRGGFTEFLREGQSIRHGTIRVQHESRRIELFLRGGNKSNRTLKGAYPFE